METWLDSCTCRIWRKREVVGDWLWIVEAGDGKEPRSIPFPEIIRVGLSLGYGFDKGACLHMCEGM